MSAATDLLTQSVREYAAELLDARAVGLLLDCSARHVRRLADRDAMPRPIKVGALTRWRAADICRWVADGCPATPRRR
jgi:predicted DNA-binding transcriptional regulator AlpA